MCNEKWIELRKTLSADLIEFIEKTGIATAASMMETIGKISDRMIVALQSGEHELIPDMERQIKSWMEVERLYLSRQSFNMLRQFLTGVFNAARIALTILSGGGS